MLLTGEEVQVRCDYILSSHKALHFNPRAAELCLTKWIDIESHVGVLENSVGAYVFVFPHEVTDVHCLNTLQQFQQPFHLVLHNSDLGFHAGLLGVFELIPNLMCIFTSNCLVNHPRVFPVPLGFQNRQWWSTEDDLAILEKHKECTKDSLVYLNFSIGTNPTYRQPCKDSLEGKGFVWNARKPFEDYVAELARNRYCVCPIGNGVDTHRFWEALAVRTVPICLHNPIVDFYAQFLPIVVLNNWEELTVEMLEGIQGIDWCNADVLLALENWNFFGPKPSVCPTASPCVDGEHSRALDFQHVPK